MNQAEQGRKLGVLIAKCWADEAFKNQVLANPQASLKAAGIELPAGVSIKAVENTDKVFHLVIPARPAELSDAELEKVSAASIEVPEILMHTMIGTPHYLKSPGT